MQPIQTAKMDKLAQATTDALEARYGGAEAYRMARLEAVFDGDPDGLRRHLAQERHVERTASWVRKAKACAS